MNYLKLGTIIDSFGLDGTLKLYSTTNNSELRYQEGNTVYIYNPETQEENPYIVEKYRKSGVFDFVKLQTIDTKEDALSKKGLELHVEKLNEQLEEGQYYFIDLVDCDVLDQNNTIVGKVKTVEEFPAQITLRIKKTDGKEAFIPFIKEFVSKVDIRNKQIHIIAIEGLL